MPNRRQNYKNDGLFLKTRNEQRKRYYRKTAFKGKRPWTAEEDKLVLLHVVTDTCLSGKIERSVSAIQVRRHNLKKLF